MLLIFVIRQGNNPIKEIQIMIFPMALIYESCRRFTQTIHDQFFFVPPYVHKCTFVMSQIQHDFVSYGILTCVISSMFIYCFCFEFSVA